MNTTQPSNSLSHYNYAIGIDLGTTNSLVAIQLNNEVVIIPDDEGNFLLPSAVSMGKSNTLLIGHQALKENEVILSSKRLMGKSGIQTAGCNQLQAFKYNVEKDKILLQSRNFKATPVEIATLILKTLKERAEKYLKTPVKSAVITVPAYFDDSARQLTKQAAEMAGLQVLRLLNEPTAAALAYGITAIQEGNYIIYDLGGGTFDVSILRIYKGISKVIAVNGSTTLGGDDFDAEIVKFISSKFLSDNFSKSSYKTLLLNAKKIKELLTLGDVNNYLIYIEGKELKISITQQQFNALITPYVVQTIKLVKEAIKASQLPKTSIKKVILAGGASKIPIIQQYLADLFQGAPLLNTLDAETVVAIGAAIQANNLINDNSNILIDVIPLSLGIETIGGIFEKIILRNSPIPTQKTQIFTTYVDNQTSIKIHIAQGEDNFINNNHSLGIFTLTDIVPLPAGQPQIKVTFTVNENSILTVTACDLATNNPKQITINPSISREEIENLYLIQELKSNLESLIVLLSEKINSISNQDTDKSTFYDLLTESYNSLQDSCDVNYLNDLILKLKTAINFLQQKHFA